MIRVRIVHPWFWRTLILGALLVWIGHDGRMMALHLGEMIAPAVVIAIGLSKVRL